MSGILYVPYTRETASVLDERTGTLEEFEAVLDLAVTEDDLRGRLGLDPGEGVPASYRRVTEDQIELVRADLAELREVTDELGAGLFQLHAREVMGAVDAMGWALEGTETRLSQSGEHPLPDETRDLFARAQDALRALHDHLQSQSK